MTLTAYASHPASLRPGLHIHVQSFGRSDEIQNLVGQASALTLPDSVRCHSDEKEELATRSQQHRSRQRKAAVTPGALALDRYVTIAECLRSSYADPFLSGSQGDRSLRRLVRLFGLLSSPDDGESKA